MFQTVLDFVSWMPDEFYALASAVISLFGLFVACRLLKLIWDALPIA